MNKINKIMKEKINKYNDKKLSDLDNTIINTGKHKGKSFKWIYENEHNILTGLKNKPI